jgi:hypothetical protein
MSTNYRDIARQKAAKYGLLPEVFERQIGAESGFNPKAVSPAGARGIAQIMPGTARGWGVNPDDPVAALDAAAKNMAGYIKTFQGGKAAGQETDPVKVRNAYEKALRAYNAGPAAVEASRKYAETNRYVQKIIGPDTFSFTDALKNKQPAQDSQAKSQEISAATPGGRVFIINAGDNEKGAGSFLQDFIQKTPGIQPTGIDVTSLLAQAFSQTPNYLG